MSSELERLLREARAALPEPDDVATLRARRRALLAVPRRRPRARALLLAAALVVALGLGVGVGTLIAPTGTAARGPVGFGFFPEPGWYALQSSARPTAISPATAVASNVPFHPDDDVQGSAESSALPYATLLSLPPRGIVITATFMPEASQPWMQSSYVPTKLPLKLKDAVRENRFGSQVRPEEPLGHHHLMASANAHHIDLHVYFGTPDPSRALLREAQRQLDELVVRGVRPSRERAPSAAASPSRPSSAEAVTIDHRLLCTVRTHGGIYEVETRAHAGFRAGPRWARLPFVTLTSGGAGGSLSGNQAVSTNALFWMTAGRPDGDTTVDNDFWTFPPRGSGTIGYNRARCAPTRRPIALAPSGLRGGPASALGEELDCATPTRVLVRVRARLESQGSLAKRGDFLSSGVPVLDARMSMRTLKGKPLVYAEVHQSGRAPLFTARVCMPD